MSDTLDHSLVPVIGDENSSENNGLWVTDATIIKRLGVSEKTGYAAIHRLDNSGLGFPAKSKIWGNKRYWPAVKDFFDREYGLKSNGSTPRSRHG